MSTIALVPVDEYLRDSEKPYCEYRDGVIYAKAMPTKLHSIIQRLLPELLQARLPKHRDAYPELTLKVSASHYLIPDVAVTDDFPGPYPTDAVHMCCEVRYPMIAWARCLPSARSITPGVSRSAG